MNIFALTDGLRVFYDPADSPSTTRGWGTAKHIDKGVWKISLDNNHDIVAPEDILLQRCFAQEQP